MAEAHRRADVAEEADGGISVGPVERFPAESLAAAASALGATAWFVLRGTTSVSSGPWQGIVLGDFFPTPLFYAWLSSLLGLLDDPGRVVTLNAVTQGLGALTAAGVGVCTVMAVRRIGTTGEALVSGVLAGILFALSQGATAAFTGTWAGAAAVACAVWMFVFLFRAVQATRGGTRWLLVAALTAGAAAANHAFFGWLLVPLFGVALYLLSQKRAGILAAGASPACWAVFPGAAMLQALFIEREPLGVFLNRALESPYPALAERSPNWDAIGTLGGQFHPIVWLVLLACAIVVGQRFARPSFFAALTVFAVAGPLAPALMNQPAEAAFPRDTIALDVIALAALAVLFGLGLAAALQVVFRRYESWGYRLATAALVLAVAGLHQWTTTQDRRQSVAGDVGQALLDGVPVNGVLVVDDPAAAGMAVAAQHAYTHRTDVVVVPKTALTSTLGRHYFRHASLGNVVVAGDYDNDSNAAAWERERPIVSYAWLDERLAEHARKDALDDLILWQFVRDNFPTRAFAFAGIDAAWLHARANVNGFVQVFPRVDAPLTDSLEAWIALQFYTNLQTNDPELDRSLSNILVAQSAAKRAQNQDEEARRLAALATRFDADDNESWLALARAAARSGLRTEAEVYSAAGLRGNAREAEAFADRLDRDFMVYEMALEFEARSLESLFKPPDPENRWYMAGILWQQDEIVLLTEILERDLRHGEATGKLLYEIAAAHAQLGDLPAARRYLKDAVEAAPEDVAGAFEDDARFVLLDRN